ncbi:hypothetical protein [Nocardia sp. NPDC049149]|uniref:hypothetical protein n=1 Tax=Nocardia sp. NPDC049149 TaxID=3364315 RepID=UPI00371288FE
MSSDILKSIGLSLGVLTLTFLIQKFLSFRSRNARAGARWGREDYLMWPDWLASGLVTLAVFLTVGDGADDIKPIQIGALLIVFGVNFLLPDIVRELCYSTTGSHTLLTWQGIVFPNVAAALTVGIAVAVGVDFAN